MMYPRREIISIDGGVRNERSGEKRSCHDVTRRRYKPTHGHRTSLWQRALTPGHTCAGRLGIIFMLAPPLASLFSAIWHPARIIVRIGSN